MKIAVLGSKGFLGRSFMEALPDDTVGFCRAGVGDFSNIDYGCWPWSSKYDCIIHCASSSDLIEQSQIDSNVIRWWRDYQPSTTTLVTFGSDASYSPDGLHSEEFYLSGTPYREWYHYAMVKRALCNQLLTITNRPSFHFVITSLFGPGFDLNDNHLIHSLVMKVIDAKTFGFSVTVGPTKVVRECVYTFDLIDNVLSFLNLPQKSGCQLFNLGSPVKNNTVLEILEEICALVDYPLASISSSVTAVDPYRKWLDSSRAQATIKYADTKWKTALEETIAYYMMNQPHNCGCGTEGGCCGSH